MPYNCNHNSVCPVIANNYRIEEIKKPIGGRPGTLTLDGFRVFTGYSERTSSMKLRSPLGLRNVSPLFDGARDRTLTISNCHLNGGADLVTCVVRQPKHILYDPHSTNNGVKNLVVYLEGRGNLILPTFIPPASYSLNNSSPMINFVVYRILNTRNRRFYIGSTSQFEIRRAEHLGQLRNRKHINKFLQADFNDFKEESFVFEIIADGFKNREAMLIREYEIILKGKKTKKCYNIHTDCPAASSPKKSKMPRRQGKLLICKKPKKPSKKELNKLARVKGNHRITTEYPQLDEIAERKRKREQNRAAAVIVVAGR